MPINSIILSILAADPDEEDAGIVRYQLTTQTEYFSLDESNGIMKLKKSLLKLAQTMKVFILINFLYNFTFRLSNFLVEY